MTERSETPSAKAAARRRQSQAAEGVVRGSGQAQAIVVTAKGDLITPDEPIEGKVAAILNELDLAINRGKEHGVVRGMRFEVLEPEGISITDPESGRVLGEETQVKIVVRVIRAEDDYSVARSDEIIPGSTSAIESLFSASLSLKQGTPSRRRTLRTEEALFTPLKEDKSFVQRGDPVRELLE